MTLTELESEEYIDFLRSLSNLKDICNDVDIRNGMIRQRSNELTTVFEIDLKSLINESTIPITDLKRKLELLRIFTGSTVTINIKEKESASESYYEVSDSDSSLKFLFPMTDFLDNKIMDQEELDTIFNLNEEDLVLDTTIDDVITERIRVISENFNTRAIQVRFSGDQASITATTQSKDQFAKVKDGIPTNVDFGDHYYSNIHTVPFGIEHDEKLNLKMYKDPEQDVLLNKISTELGPTTINIYSRSALIKEEE